jgi:hypothetical protein
MPSSPIENRLSRQYSIRLPWQLSDAVQSFASQHRIAANRAIIELLARGLNAPRPTNALQKEPHALERLAVLEDFVQTLQDTIETLRAQGATKASPSTQQELPGDPTSYLGALCHRGHDWDGTGMSRRSKRNHDCLECKAVRRREWRRTRRATKA